MSAILEQIKDRRKQLYEELKAKLEMTSSDDFRYAAILVDFQKIFDSLEQLREEELDILTKKELKND